MKISDWLKTATGKLESADIGTARLDALVLAEDATGRDRAYLLAHPDLNVRDLISHKLDEQIKRRVRHEPLAFIRGKTEFYGREFKIDWRVLEPRPESETMIDLLKKIVKGRTYHIVDVGTGSGALAITAKLELPNIEVSATDIDPGCLAVARANARDHLVEVEFIKTDLLEAIENRSNLMLLANLPYVPDSFTINQAAMHEPKIAIFGGPDGLDLYRRLFEQIKTKSLDVSYIFTESMPPQHTKLTEIAAKYDFKLKKTEDFIQLFVRA